MFNKSLITKICKTIVIWFLIIFLTQKQQKTLTHLIDFRKLKTIKQQYKQDTLSTN